MLPILEMLNIGLFSRHFLSVILIGFSIFYVKEPYWYFDSLFATNYVWNGSRYIHDVLQEK